MQNQLKVKSQAKKNIFVNFYCKKATAFVVFHPKFLSQAKNFNLSSHYYPILVNIILKISQYY